MEDGIEEAGQGQEEVGGDEVEGPGQGNTREADHRHEGDGKPAEGHVGDGHRAVDRDGLRIAEQKVKIDFYSALALKI